MSLQARLSIGAMATLACLGTAQACEIPNGWSAMDGGAATVEVILNQSAKAAKIGKRFDLELIVCGDEVEAVERVVVDANMPAHRHGMNYRPIVTTLDAGRYKASGMLFHMPGEWQIVVDTFSAQTTRRHVLDVMVK